MEQTLPLVVLAAIAGKSARHTSSIFPYLWARDGALYEIQYGILLWRMELNFQMGIPMFKSIEEVLYESAVVSQGNRQQVYKVLKL